MIVVSFFIILLPFTFLAGMLYKKALLIAGNTDAFLEPLKALDKKLQEDYHFELLSEKNLSGIQSYFTDFISGILSQGLNLISAMGMMYFILFFMITNLNRMEAAIVFYLPFKREKIMLFANELRAQTVSNALGVPMIAVIQGLLAWAYYTWVGLSNNTNTHGNLGGLLSISSPANNNLSSTATFSVYIPAVKTSSSTYLYFRLGFLMNKSLSFGTVTSTIST